MTPDGIILNINKPTGITSFSVVRKVRKISNTKKVGHGGTLDPFASGVLLILVGREATRKFEELKELRKQYQATFRLGLQTNTHDIDGKVKQDELVNISEEELQHVFGNYFGEVEQLPPMYSAKRIGGKRLYEYARQGETVEREPTQVKIYDIAVDRIQERDVTLEITCSSGTYIRALGRDVGSDLGTGAAVTRLTRTAVGHYSLDDSISLTDVEDTWNSITA